MHTETVPLGGRYVTVRFDVCKTDDGIDYDIERATADDVDITLSLRQQADITRELRRRDLTAAELARAEAHFDADVLW